MTSQFLRRVNFLDINSDVDLFKAFAHEWRDYFPNAKNINEIGCLAFWTAFLNIENDIENEPKKEVKDISKILVSPSFEGEPS